MLEYIKIHPLLDPIAVIHGGFLVSWLGGLESLIPHNTGLLKL